MDKDFFQLVHDGLRVFNPRDEGTWYDAAGVKEKFGVSPDQVVDVMALMGDTIDNIKGVPGIGEKGAKELIGKYGSLDNLIAHAVRADAETSRDAARQRGRRAPEPRPGDHPHGRARRFRSTGRASTAAANAAALLSDLQRARVHDARQGIRADGGFGDQDYRIIEYGRRCARAGSVG